MEENTQYMTIATFAKRIGVHPQTIRSWEKSGRLKPHHKTLGGSRRYSEEQVQMVLQQNNANETNTSTETDANPLPSEHND